MVHDWFVHKKGTWRHTHDIPLDDGDDWHERPMRVPKTPADAAEGRRVDEAAGVHQREHALVGRLACIRQQSRRPGVAPRRPRGQGAGQPERAAGGRSGHRAARSPASPRTAGSGSACCTRCLRSSTTPSATSSRQHNPHWDDERLFQQARLVNSALLAKIHTVEWSTAILPREVTQRPDSEPTGTDGSASCRTCSRSSPTTTSSPGFPVRRPSTTACRFRMTEEFVSVYRMHTLMPDHFTIRSADTGDGLANAELPELSGRRGVEFLARFNPADLFYSFGSPQSRRGAAAQLSRSSCRTWCRTTASGSTSAPSTSCATASAACRATTGSAGCCTSRRSGASRS